MSGFPPPPPGTDLTESRAVQLYCAEMITFVIGLTGVILRFITRRLSGAGYWLDDYLIIPPTLMLITIVGIAAKQDTIFGHHMWAVGYSAQVWAMQFAYADEIIYLALIGLTKFSILALYWRIFKTSGIRLPILATGALVLGWMIACTVATTLQCQPFEKEINVILPGTCIDIKSYFLGNAIVNILTDVILLVLPLPPIFKIQRPLSQKALVAGIFACGGLIIVFSCLRLQALLSIDLTSLDLTWNYTDTWIWSSIEINIAVFSACLPTLRPFCKFLRTGSFRDQPSTNQSRSKGSKNSASSGPESFDMPAKHWNYVTADEVSV